jgi:hypothetical protein
MVLVFPGLNMLCEQSPKGFPEFRIIIQEVPALLHRRLKENLQ